MKKLVLSILSIFLVFGLLFVSCEEGTEFDPDSDTAEDNARADGVFGDVFMFGANNTSGDDGGKALLDECFTVTTDTLDGMVTLKLTFDEAGCDLGDGIIRKGAIIYTFMPNWFQDEGKVVTTTFENFSRDDYVVDGEVKIVFAKLEGIHPTHTIIATGMKLTSPEGQTVSWSGTRTVKWLNGFLTRRDKTDDKLEINSEITGTNRNGESYTTIGALIVKDFSCQYKLPISGIMTINKGTDVISVDFGAGACDCEYVVTQGGVSIPINACE